MPIEKGLRLHIEITIPDLVDGDTVIRRKARYLDIKTSQNEAGEYSLLLSTEVSMYAAAGNGFGPKLTLKGFSTYPVHLVANNDTIVSFPDGTILETRERGPGGHTPEMWQGILDRYEAAPEVVYLQGDYFEWLSYQSPPRQHELIAYHMQQAVAMGRYDAATS